MSRSAHQRQQQKLQLQQQQQQMLAQQQQIADNDAAAAAAEMFDLFCVATTMRQILGLHRNICDLVGLHPAPLNEFYPKLKAKIRSWKAQALWKKFDARAAHRVYAKGNACTGTRVLVIGAGPCGLRTAIEAQLLGAKVVVLEKRDRISRNNVLHLWPFVITDLRNLGAKKFYGKFCAGSIDHISIRQLQCILLKVALLLGVEIHEGVSFDSSIEPSGDGCGWRAAVTPADHAVSHYEFDVLIGADGKRNTLEGFRRKEFRGKLAIAITANFINKKTEAEAKAEEISGVAFIFNQSFFKELYHTTGIDLENIVYYKDETHYFVMTAKKHSLIDKGVIMQDFADPAELLAPANVNTDKLLDYAREAAEFSTKYQMPNLEFAVNHYGKPDVAMFDFTSMFAAETSCRVIVRKGFRLLQCLVGDSLLEPFWPTGSGCARGFLSSMDAAYAIKLWSNARNSTLGVLAQRESIYRLLNQTTPENLQRDTGSYTVDPATRYPNLNRSSVNVWQVKHLVDTDDKAILEQTFMETNALPTTQTETPVRRKRRSGDSVPLSAVLLRWICAQLHAHDFVHDIKEVSDVFTNGKVLCALINRYRPDLVDFNAVKDLSAVESNEIAFDILDRELHIPRIMSGKDAVQLAVGECKLWLNYLEQICEVFRGEIPHVKHPKMDFSDLREKYRINYKHAQPDFSKLLQLSSKQSKPTKTIANSVQDMVDVPQVTPRRSLLDEEKLKRIRKLETPQATGAAVASSSGQQGQTETPRRAKKRRSAEKASNIDRDRSDIPSALPRGNADEQFSDRIKSMEQRITSRNTYGTEKKPKDLLRAIGKIDSSDWNVREIEKKIEQSKKTEIHGPMGREKVPKWSKEQFKARQTKMSKPNRQNSTDEKFKEIDQTLKNLDKQLKEGSVLEIGERGRNKVASIAGQFVKKDDTSEEKNPPTVVAKSSSKVALAFKKQAASEKCHFCKQTVYLMEKISAEGLILHRSCLKCHHCHTNLRPGGYAFDRDDPNGRFYCTQHFRLPAKAIRPVVRKPGQRKSTQQKQQQLQQAEAAPTSGTAVVDSDGKSIEPKTPEKLRVHADNVAQLDLLDRGQTPERIEFENTDAMSDGEPSEEHIIDEHEWSGRNFLPESNNDSESDLSSSDDESDTDSDSEMYEEANDSPIAAQTLQLANDWIDKQKYTYSDDDSDDFYDSSDGIADDGKDDTEGEEFKKARELRREEVRLPPLPPNLPTDTETEVPTESDTTTPDEVELNSATEISTDSEFDHDEVNREPPKIFIDDTHLRKPTKVQIKSGIIMPSLGQKHNHHHHYHQHYHPHQQQVKNNVVGAGSYLQKYQTQQAPPPPQFKPLVQVDPTLLLSSNRTPLQNPRPGDYLLNKTASTEGIASKKSLELKKRYLLGEPANGNKIQKSGSTSVLDSKIRSFQSNISECQKLLNPSSDKSASMKSFLDRTKLGESNKNELLRSATTNILNDLKVEITIQKASSAASTDNEKENMFVNSKNELNKGMEYAESVNSTLLNALDNKSPATPTNNETIIFEDINLVTPEKPIEIIDLTNDDNDQTPKHHNKQLFTADSNKIIDLTNDTPPLRNVDSIELKPDVSKDVKQCIPDILGHIEKDEKVKKEIIICAAEEEQKLLAADDSNDEEKRDSPEKLLDQYEHDTLQIKVPNIPWNAHKSTRDGSSTEEEEEDEDATSCSSNSSSIEDIQHYILESTTSPDTNTSALPVPRVEIHDSSGTLMQIDSLMIIDGKYIGDPEDLKYMELPAGVVVPAPQQAVLKTAAFEDEAETEVDLEPVTATPEPAERTVIEATVDMEQEVEPPPLPEQGPPLPERGPPILIPSANLKFDTKNENKIESLKHLPLIVDQSIEHAKVVKPITLNLSSAKSKSGSLSTPTTPTAALNSPLVDNDKTPTAEMLSRGSDSETEATGTGQVLTETELSDWTADDCISENFIDVDYGVNANNKGTIKRNKKGKKKHNKLPSTSEMLSEVAKVAPVAILETIDIDDIEFMDTGSEGSAAEAYCATNTALLRNRGYIEFIETTAKTSGQNSQKAIALETAKSVSNIGQRAEKLGIDYIEQGAYIMQQHTEDALKTPVNEMPQAVSVPNAFAAGNKSLVSSVMTASLTDSSTLNDLDDDSLFVASTNTKTTTEESEALTVVTSPLDSSSPKTQDPAIGLTTSAPLVGKGLEKHAHNSTPSSSEKNPKTSQSTSGTCAGSSSTSNSLTTSNISAQRTPKEQSLSQNPCTRLALHANELTHKSAEELSCDYDYVRALQQKITEISSARDSLDSRKQRRKSSKGDAQAAISNLFNTPSVIEEQNAAKHAFAQQCNSSNVDHFATAAAAAEKSALLIRKVPEIPTLERKLEEITKERTKQKDLIHDLVMDKLQSKKQLNAEKRLHRSRQRTLLTSGYTSGSSLSPTPKIAAAATTEDNNCTSQAHYHVSTAAKDLSAERYTASKSPSSFKENLPLQITPTYDYISPYSDLHGTSSPTRIAAACKQRPFSEHINADILNAFESNKLTKTASFACQSQNQNQSTTQQQQKKHDNPTSSSYVFAGPFQSTRQQNEATAFDSIYASTENLRQEARARARLKSNSELGLSPEEKMQLLRKRLYAEYLKEKHTNAQPTTVSCSNDSKESQLKARDRKMSSSKSVNDLAYLASLQQNATADENFNTKSTNNIADFTSDPNLLLSSQSAQNSPKQQQLKTNKNQRRQKDPERRKSLIQSLSSFFHKSSSTSKKTENDAIANASAGNSAQSERPGTSGSNTTTTSGSGDGMFSRFRISPKSKEKSKEKDLLSLTNNQNINKSAATAAMRSMSTTSPATTSKVSATSSKTHERSISQDFLLKSATTHVNNTNNSHNYNNTNNSCSNNSKHYHKKSSSSGTFSSSSPQLYVQKSSYTGNADEQTPPPIPPLPLNYQRSDDESYATETRDQKKQRAISKAVRQAELKRLRIAQEIQREQEEIEVQLKELEARGVLIEKALRGEGQTVEDLEGTAGSTVSNNINDEKLLKELLEIWRNITHLKKRDEELTIREQELKLEYRHAKLKEQLNMRLSCSKLDKSSADVAAEGAILNEMLEIVAKRAALRPGTSNLDLSVCVDGTARTAASEAVAATGAIGGLTLGQTLDTENESII